MSKKVYAHLTGINKTTSNLGDMMGFLISDWIIGGDNYRRIGIMQSKEIDKQTFTFVGSMIGSVADSEITVVGGGLVNKKVRQYNNSINIVAVRGDLTKECVERDTGRIPEVIGDPGLLISDIHPCMKRNDQRELGFIIHSVDREEFYRRFPHYKDLLVDNYQAADSFVKQLTKYDAVVSTSLHGVIFCHAYGIKVAPFKLTNKVIGGDFKYIDYYSSLGICIDGRLDLVGGKKELYEKVSYFPQPSAQKIYDLKSIQSELIQRILFDK